MAEAKRVKVKRQAASGRSLESYRRKRDPEKTPEPFGEARARGGKEHLFVIQQHWARRMHWDFRLEIDGVLASWAVPKGPSVDPTQRRLAVQTEDHPLEYADFEGIIPAGNYGAGAVIVWDRGTYRIAGEGSAAEGLAAGKLDFELFGHKLRGRWALVRLRRGGEKDWLLIHKGTKRAAPPEPVRVQPGSVLSGLTVEELREGVSRGEALSQRARELGAPRRAVDVRLLRPMLAETAPKAFSRPGWIFELKYDGVRALSGRDASGAVRILSRNQRNVTASFPEIAAALEHLPCERFVIDGEIVALDERGASSFERLQRRLGLTERAAVAQVAAQIPLVMYCFDLLAVDGYDLRGLALSERKAMLRQLVPGAGILRFSDHVEEQGRELFDAAVEHRLEGVVGKRADSRYESGRRSRNWLKVKAVRTADLAVIGYLPGKGSRQKLGSLMLAWSDGGDLLYAGNVGSGLGADAIDDLLPRLEERRRSKPPCRGVPDSLTRKGRFVEPGLVAEVRYGEVTTAGVLRHPVFLGLREDKTPEDCDVAPLRAELAVPAKVEKPAAPEVKLTNLDKVFWPDDGYTKGDMLQYYEGVWPVLAPYLRDRPLVLTRYPDGIAGKSFYQKNAPDFIPDWVRTFRVEGIDYFICNDVETLLYIANSACIPIHVWSSRCTSIDRPDWAILDLDPKGAPFAHVVAMAKEIHRLLRPLGVPHYVKTSGQDGLHVLIPLDGSLDHREARTFAEVLARVVTAARPDIATVARPLGARGGKVYVDFLQNGSGKTIAAPFSVRPRPGAPVSTPLDWKEVNARLDPRRFTIKTVPQRLRRKADPMRELLETHADVGAALAELSKSLGR